MCGVGYSTGGATSCNCLAHVGLGPVKLQWIGFFFALNDKTGSSGPIVINSDIVGLVEFVDC